MAVIDPTTGRFITTRTVTGAIAYPTAFMIATRAQNREKQIVAAIMTTDPSARRMPRGINGKPAPKPVPRVFDDDPSRRRLPPVAPLPGLPIIPKILPKILPKIPPTFKTPIKVPFGVTKKPGVALPAVGGAMMAVLVGLSALASLRRK